MTKTSIKKLLCLIGAFAIAMTLADATVNQLGDVDFSWTRFMMRTLIGLPVFLLAYSGLARLLSVSR